MTIFAERATAKINLTLEVLGRRADGYHELRSLVAFARDAADVVTLDISRPAGCEVNGPFGGSIAGQNLIEVTLAKLAQVDAGLQLGHVTLTKNLPVAAGIGGGSADAAAVLRAVTRANIGRSVFDVRAIALSIGSDVPVCCANQLAWMTGTGDGVMRLEASGFETMYAVIANPRVAVPADKTAQVYRALRAPPLAPDAELEIPWLPELRPKLLSYMAQTKNALQPAAIKIVPEIAIVLDELAALPGAKLTRMSGGGPTCFAMFDTADAATAAAAKLSAGRPGWWVIASELE